MAFYNELVQSLDELTGQTPIVKKGFRISFWFENKERSNNESLGSRIKRAFFLGFSRLPLPYLQSHVKQVYIGRATYGQ